MRARYPIGVSDFRTLRDEGYAYVDKSGLIVELLRETGAQVVLLPRPRRFGKTLNLSMLRYFFERSDEPLDVLFEELEVWRSGECRAHFQRYPVIYLSFKAAKLPTAEGCFAHIKATIRDAFVHHRELLDQVDHDALDVDDERQFRAMLADTAELVHYQRALATLSRLLHRATGERAVILIDEYDCPIHAGHNNGFAREILDFFRAFLITGLKDNPHLKRGVITGILRVARESIFSGLNNVAVYTLLDEAFASSFGFTETQVDALLAGAELGEQRERVRRWYNGYSFGGTIVYNPWSVLNFLERRVVSEYWLNTSANELIRTSLREFGPRHQPEFEALLAGESVEVTLDSNVVLEQLAQRSTALWSLLVFSGYLRAEPLPRVDGQPARYRVAIPNLEVRQIYATSFREWFEARTSEQGGSQRRLIAALLSGDADNLEDQLGALLANVVSYHDFPDRDLPERFYQAFLLGLLCTLEPDYRVRSNREAGQGRPDVQIFPNEPGKPGVVLELKVARARRRTLEAALAEGVAQIEARDYAAELRAAGASPIHRFALAFDGKQLRVVAVEL